MKKIILFAAAIILVFTACELAGDNSETTKLSLNLTDAPALPMSFGEITEVNIKISKVTASVGEEDEWVTLIDFTETGETGEFDLLDFQEGNIAALVQNVEIPAGRIGQIRFYLDASEDDTISSSCNISYTDLSGDPQTMDIVIPSANKSGLKLVGGFDVPSNGEIAITADFDARKSLINKSSYLKMKPTIKLIVEGEAGHISGTVSGVPSSGYTGIAVYAYEDGDYAASELEFDLTVEGEEIPMMKSVGTAGINDDGTFKIAYLAEGTYDLYVVGLLITDPVTEAGNYSLLAAELADVAVTSGEITVDQDITIVP